MTDNNLEDMKKSFELLGEFIRSTMPSEAECAECEYYRFRYRTDLMGFYDHCMHKCLDVWRWKTTND